MLVEALTFSVSSSFLFFALFSHKTVHAIKKHNFSFTRNKWLLDNPFFGLMEVGAKFGQTSEAEI